ncbi:hypothetical protein N0V85_007971 [Neurospora sp. IMI 360204]|nr:hypothetical protein N0V85_007971 [Neurospora sp. IMI 360204]
MDGNPITPEVPVQVVSEQDSGQPVFKQSHAPFKSSLFPQTGSPEAYNDLFPAHGRCGDDLHSLYHGPPASTRPSPSPTGPPSFDFESFLATEFDLSKVHAIKHRLWIAGRPVPPRSLQTQITQGREVVVSEKMELHLVWGRGKVYLKPLAKFLLCKKFWDDELGCRGEGNCQGGQRKRVGGGWEGTEGAGGGHSDRDKMMLLNTEQEVASKKDSSELLCKRCEARQAALGLLFSYIALIQRESDLETAQEKGLVPREIRWPQWRLFVHEFLSPTSRYHPVHHDIAIRFIYGELRLHRLDMIYLVSKPLSLGFMPLWTSSGDFVVNNSSWIIGGTAWIVVVLSAMQVALGTDMGSGDQNPPLQRASYGFAIFSMLGPIASFALLFVYLVVILVCNLVRTRDYERKRSDKLGRVWSDLHQSKEKSSRRGKVSAV